MYRLNRCNSNYTRDKIDPRVLARIAAERQRAKNTGDCGCGCNDVSVTREAGNNGCDCNNDENYHSEFNYSLAMVYSPYQQFQNLYCEEEGFVAGTIFKELDKPFYGPKCNGGMCNE